MACDYVKIYHVTNSLLKTHIARNENQNNKLIKSGNARSLKKIRNFSCRLLCAKPPTKVVPVAQTNQNTKKLGSVNTVKCILAFSLCVCHIFINSHTFQRKRKKTHATEGVQIYFRWVRKVETWRLSITDN